MSKIVPGSPKFDARAQSLWQEVAEASDEVATLVDSIPGLTVTGAETRSELERAAALLKAVADILKRTERREGSRYATTNRSILGPDPVS
jgi:ABC-type transporter Mla subunit MlaD